jgi:hypothetical protein
MFGGSLSVQEEPADCCVPLRAVRKLLEIHGVHAGQSARSSHTRGNVNFIHKRKWQYMSNLVV